LRGCEHVVEVESVRNPQLLGDPQEDRVGITERLA
jgi:hypothetical protein